MVVIRWYGKYSNSDIECIQLTGPSWASLPPWPCIAGSLLYTNAYIDSDRDGIPNSMEISLGTNPILNDSDGDGITDGDEIVNFTDPMNFHDPGFFAPALSYDRVNPSTGSQQTLFNFSVQYADQDNNTPVHVSLLLDGVPLLMEKQNQSDQNYVDGCIYRHSRFLPPGNHSWWIEAEDRRFLARTPARNITVSASNVNVPILTSPKVELAKGFDPEQSLSFSVVYSDYDNNEPSDVVLTLDAENYTMTKQNATDLNYIDGCVYSRTIYLALGIHAYKFSCIDGVFNSSLNLEMLNFTCIPQFKVSDNRTWGGMHSTEGNSVWSDGEFVYTCGDTSSFGDGCEDLLLVKWDMVGNQVWNRTWGGTLDDYGVAVCGEGTSIYTCGYTYSFGAGGVDIVLVKWDTAGNQVWNRTWGGTDYDHGVSVWCDSTAIYTCGYSGMYDGYDGVLIKWDPTGNQVWNRTRGDCSFLAMWGDETSIYTCGHNTGNGGQNLLLIKWNAVGGQIWNRTWGGTSSTYGHSVFGDGTYIYTCGSIAIDYLSGEIALIKWDSAGNFVWNRTWGSLYSEKGNSLWCDEMSIYVSGYAYNYSDHHDHLLLLKWDNEGNFVYNCSWGGTGTDRSISVWGNGSAIYTCGYTSSFGNTAGDLLLLKWDGLECTPVNRTFFLELRNPVNATCILAGENVFAWNFLGDIDGFVNYTLQISTFQDFSTLNLEVMNILSSSLTTDLNVQINFSTNKYYWRVGIASGIYAGNWSPPFTFILVTNNFCPVLSQLTAEPLHGTTQTSFTFSIRYTDADNNPPAHIGLLIDSKVHALAKTFPGDVNYTDGCDFTFTTMLGLGNHSYQFTCDDGRFNSSTTPRFVIVINPLSPLNNPLISTLAALGAAGAIVAVAITGRITVGRKRYRTAITRLQTLITSLNASMLQSHQPASRQQRAAIEVQLANVHRMHASLGSTTALKLLVDEYAKCRPSSLLERESIVKQFDVLKHAIDNDDMLKATNTLRALAAGVNKMAIEGKYTGDFKQQDVIIKSEVRRVAQSRLNACKHQIGDVSVRKATEDREILRLLDRIAPNVDSTRIIIAFGKET
nr:hypothetical protein [Candidatus Sigynarchaeota archaeon]